MSFETKRFDITHLKKFMSQSIAAGHVCRLSTTKEFRSIKKVQDDRDIYMMLNVRTFTINDIRRVNSKQTNFMIENLRELYEAYGDKIPDTTDTNPLVKNKNAHLATYTELGLKWKAQKREEKIQRQRRFVKRWNKMFLGDKDED